MYAPVIIPRLYVFQPSKPSTVAGIELTGPVHINYRMYWILPLGHTSNDLCGVTDLLYTHTRKLAMCTSHVLLLL